MLLPALNRATIVGGLGLALWLAPPALVHAEQTLDQAADDPTASLSALQVSDWYTASFHGLESESANSVVLRPVLPFMLGGAPNIFRATLPFVTNHPSADAGFGDTVLFDLVVFPEAWGRWGVGPVLLMPTGGRDRGTRTWAAGPAAGFTVRQTLLLWGLFNQNLFGFAGAGNHADVQVSILQPIVSRALGDGWSVGGSEMTATYDWDEDRWSSLPLGVKAAKLVTVDGLMAQLSLQYEYDFADDEFGPKSTYRFTAKFLFP